MNVPRLAATLTALLEKALRYSRHDISIFGGDLLSLRAYSDKKEGNDKVECTSSMVVHRDSIATECLAFSDRIAQPVDEHNKIQIYTHFGVHAYP